MAAACPDLSSAGETRTEGQANGDGAFETAAEALARLIEDRDDAEDKLEVAAAEKAVWERRKARLQKQVRELEVELMAKKVESTSKDEQLQSLSKVVAQRLGMEVTISELEAKVFDLEEQLKYYVDEKESCIYCSRR